MLTKAETYLGVSIEKVLAAWTAEHEPPTRAQVKTLFNMLHTLRIRQTSKQSWSRRKKAQGLCYVCGKPVSASNKSLCDFHRAKTAERYKALRLERIQNGICGQCNQPAEPGFKLCPTHRAALNARQSTYRTRKRTK